MIQALADVIHTYPGWTMACIVVICLGIASRIEGRK